MLARFVGILAALAGVAVATPASAHAMLVGTTPANGTVLNEAPNELRLTFNEAVNPTVLPLIDVTGATTELTDFNRDGPAIVIPSPDLALGTHILSWRVVSVDGHPIGGSVVFSVGGVTLTDVAAEEGTPLLRPLIWISRVILYVGLFIGVGGVFFFAWVGASAPISHGALQTVRISLVAGVAAIPFAFAFQGADLLGLGPEALLLPAVWGAAAATSYAATLIAALVTLSLALLSLRAHNRRRWLALIAFIGIGIALSLSGHASRAPPQFLSWLVVLLHALGVAFWTGALVPLAFLLREGTNASLPPLQRFTVAAPHALAPLIVAGALLIFIQVRGVSELWTTDYGRVLAAKLAVVTALFIVAVTNRYSLAPLVTVLPREGGRALRRSVLIELVLVVLIFGIVAGWRFTPPPRTLDSAPAAETSAIPLQATTRIVDQGLVAELKVLPGTSGEVVGEIVLSASDGTDLEPLEVTLAFANPTLGIEPIEVAASLGANGAWETPPFIIPVDGEWSCEVTVLVSDFDRRTLRGTITIEGH